MEINYTSNPIPVKGYVKQFIDAGNTLDPFVLKSIYNLFSKSDAPASPTLFDIDYPTIVLPLPEKVFLSKGYALSNKNVNLVNDILEGYIKLLFACELKANIRRSIKEQRKFSIREMILELCAELKLTDENFPFETIKKILQRYCERENIDLQSIKIYGKSVPKKQVSVTISSHLLKRKEFIQKFEISPSTYTRMKNERGQLSVVKKGKVDFINIPLSVLPPIYCITYSQ